MWSLISAYGSWNELIKRQNVILYLQLNALFKENGYEYQVAGASQIVPNRKKR
jgi:hypothetical protein